MRKFFIILFPVFLLLFSGAIFAYTPTDVSNAGFLTNHGIITYQNHKSLYRLDDEITRAEAIGIALKMKGTNLPNSYTCKNYFIDAPYNSVNNWICRAVELAADDGIISRANIKARPQDSISRAEALAIIINAAFYNNISTASKGYQFSSDTVEWQQNIFYAAEDFISLSGGATAMNYVFSGRPNMPIFINYWPNIAATRAEIFDILVNIIEKKEAKIPDTISFNGDIVEDINKVSEGYDMVLVDKYDTHYGNVQEPLVIKVRYNYGKKLTDLLYESTGFTIGSETIQGNVWFLNSCDMGGSNSYTFYTQDYSFEVPGCIYDTESAANDIQLKFTNQQILKNTDILDIYYKFLNGKNIYAAYNMRSPAGVSLETFQSWYKNVENIVFRGDTLKDLGSGTYEFLIDMTENGIKSTYKVKSKVNLENFKINNISSVKQ